MRTSLISLPAPHPWRRWLATAAGSVLFAGVTFGLLCLGWWLG